MIVYRIAQTKYAQDITGSGAKKYGGRWNRPGVAALYTSQQRSLCMLELLVHFNAQAAFKQDYSFIFKSRFKLAIDLLQCRLRIYSLKSRIVNQ